MLHVHCIICTPTVHRSNNYRPRRYQLMNNQKHNLSTSILTLHLHEWVLRSLSHLQCSRKEMYNAITHVDTCMLYMPPCSIRASYELARTLACSFRSLNFDLFIGGLPLSSSSDAPPPTLVYSFMHRKLYACMPHVHSM